MEARTTRERKVWEALDVLKDQGIRPQDITGEMIKEQLSLMGHRYGSNSDLYAFRKTWFQTQKILSPNRAQPISSSVSTVALSDPLIRATQLIRKQLEEESQVAIKACQETADKQIQALNNKIYRLEAMLSSEYQQKDLLQKESQQLEKTNADLSQALQQEKIQHHSIKERETILSQQLPLMEKKYESHIQDLKVTYQKNTAYLKQQIDDLLSRYKSEISEYQIKLQSLTKIAEDQIMDLKRQRKQLHKDLADREDKIKQYEMTALSKDNEINRLNVLLKDIQKECAEVAHQLKKCHEDYRLALQDKNAQIALLQGKLEQSQAHLLSVEKKQQSLQQSLMKAKESVLMLQAEKKQFLKKKINLYS